MTRSWVLSYIQPSRPRPFISSLMKKLMLFAMNFMYSPLSSFLFFFLFCVSMNMNTYYYYNFVWTAVRVRCSADKEREGERIWGVVYFVSTFSTQGARPVAYTRGLLLSILLCLLSLISIVHWTRSFHMRACNAHLDCFSPSPSCCLFSIGCFYTILHRNI